MELKVSSPQAGGLLHSDCVSDREEKEISDDDDDDRNHKHRRRETRSHSMERDALEQVLIRPYRKRNKHFENGHPYRENLSQSSEIWKSYNAIPMEKDLSAKFEKRRPGLATFPLAPNRVIQSLSADIGPGRTRGRESGSWSQRDPRFSSVDVATQMVPQGSVPPNLFAGRGVPNVPNPHSASWSAFGLIPGVPNGGLDTLHSLGLQGTIRPSISPLKLGIPHQRCRDFEERGFCLRGDICPMEHGVNRIVVEDVQSLSQFNLPVSLPSAHLLGTPALPSIGAPSSTLANSKSLHIKSSKSGIPDNGLGMNGIFTASALAGGADFYDPDQPLWSNDCPDPSTSVLGLNPSKLDEAACLLDTETSDHHHVRLLDGTDDDHPVRSTGTAVDSLITSSSVWGRIGRKNKFGIKEKIDATIGSSKCIDNEAKEDQGLFCSLQASAGQGKQIMLEDSGPQVIDSSLNARGDTSRNTRKSSQKALRTLFVNGIPQKDNKRESLLSHFQKFGEVIDVYIPLNSERAFVQFSKREEAEAALKAPDAVMGNRFIKLWWANRDSIPDCGMSSGNISSLTSCRVAAVSIPSHLSIACRGKDNPQTAGPKISVPNASVTSVPAFDSPKPVVTNSPKAQPPSQKKLDSLELLKEELRKKQELLDQKRNDFRRKLDKFEKQATGLKGEVISEQNAKRQKAETVADVAKAAIPRSIDSGTVVASPHAELVDGNRKSVENVIQQSSKPNTVVALQQPIYPLAPAGAPFVMNRFKLDNRPTTFRIIPPLPPGLAKVAVLKEHFSIFGEISAVELEDEDTSDSVTSKNCSALISFSTRRSAERAFASGKCWQGHNLQFMWLASGNSRNDSRGRENPPSASKVPSDANLQPAGQAVPLDSKKVAAAGNGESEALERKDSSGECTECKDMQSSSSTMSCDN